MSEPFDRRTRRQILKLYDQGKSTTQVAAAVGGCESAVRRIRQQHRERGTLDPLPHAGGHPGRSEQDEAALRELTDADPDAYLYEVRDRLQKATGTRRGTSTIGRWLREMGITRKKRRPTPPSRRDPMSPRPGSAGSTS